MVYVMLVGLDAVLLIKHVLWPFGFTHPRPPVDDQLIGLPLRTQANAVNLFCASRDAIVTDKLHGGAVPPGSGCHGPRDPRVGFTWSLVSHCSCPT